MSDPMLYGDFGEALDYIRDGKKVARAGWNGRGMWVALQTPDTNSKMTLPYIYIRTVEGNLVPWVISQADIFAHDWVIVPEPAE